MPAKVVMKAGIPTKAIQKPWNTPMAAPMSSESRSVGMRPMPVLYSIALRAPENATTEPTERSMLPMMMTSTMPTARIRM